MKRMAIMLTLALVVGIAVGVIGTQLLHAQQEPVKVTELVKTDLAGVPGREAQMYLVDIAPGATTGKHYHHGHTFVYVLRGAARLEEGKPPVTFKAGQAFHELPQAQHNFKNASKTQPVKLLVFMTPEKGHPFGVPVK